MRRLPVILGGFQEEETFPRSEIPPLAGGAMGLALAEAGGVHDDLQLMSGQVLPPLCPGVGGECLGGWVWLCLNVNNE